ncbi:outer-membrane lipoprotein carrier protein LolA [Rodentibacter rarus]|uniref:Outer-membrane lipoprotein carrier protein n=1 Tax=Rodentibacter rarus TaxID=1908260 RepID=A0A1V3IQX9_9PAST|nr:outer membrane lipoprotein chaperone LolA [Rodentibacter rarus]OOF38173.1 outer-membrane lipoprotein carrier protein LolA [Rodentibacter rarus]OOF44526.1 outer-membrane lipoprotein carrier protein LolA [Rodentibacter rarus]
MTALSLMGLGLIGFANNAFADVTGELQSRLSQVNVLSADFSQTVTSAGGKNVQQGSGKIQIKRPNLFRMETKSPQETQIIADGKTLWYYDPFVQQVTAQWVKDAINNTPFVLLTSDDKSHWNQYSVTQQADTFVLKPKSAKSNIKQFDIRVDANGVLKNFSTTEKDGQTNLYVLRNITNVSLSESLFQFKLPKGVELDDQRKK